MIKVVSDKGKWNVIIDEIEYSFYYSDAEPLKGLFLVGSNTQENEYHIGNHIITATRVDCIYNNQGYRYILKISTRG